MALQLVAALANDRHLARIGNRAQRAARRINKMRHTPLIKIMICNIQIFAEFTNEDQIIRGLQKLKREVLIDVEQTFDLACQEIKKFKGRAPVVEQIARIQGVPIFEIVELCAPSLHVREIPAPLEPGAAPEMERNAVEEEQKEQQSQPQENEEEIEAEGEASCSLLLKIKNFWESFCKQLKKLLAYVKEFVLRVYKITTHYWEKMKSVGKAMKDVGKKCASMVSQGMQWFVSVFGSWF